jgi:hypothetical protein
MIDCKAAAAAVAASSSPSIKPERIQPNYCYV